MNRDTNLLFGMLALQMDFLSRDALMDAMQAQLLAGQRPLGDILLERGFLTPERHALLEGLLREHVKEHGGDPARSLAAVCSRSPSSTPLHREVATLATHGSDVTDDPFATRPPLPSSPEQSSGRFKILRPLGRGGLGEVFVALDRELHREVALKQVLELFADDPESQRRFLLEGEVTGKLEHPGIVPVYSLGRHPDGRPYYAMRCIRGETLQDRIDRLHASEEMKREPRKREMEVRRLLQRFLDVCNAVEYAHSQGWLHRDLKPSNIMLGPHGETLLLDWGLARQVRSAEEKPIVLPVTLTPDQMEGNPPFAAASSGFPVPNTTPTQPGRVLGTPAFMPPEQAAGRLNELGPTSDVYALGATLYTLLTGKPAFIGENMGRILQQVEQGDFPSPRSVNRNVPASLETVCLKAMARRPVDRYPSARALAEDLERWMADEPVKAHGEPFFDRVRRLVRRHWTLILSLVVIVAIIALAFLIGFLLVNSKNSELNGKNEQLNQKNDQLNQRLYFSKVRLAANEIMQNNPGRAGELLDECDKEHRNWEWRYLQRQLLNGPASLSVRHQLPVYAVAISPDGKLAASGGADAQLILIDLATGKQVLTLRTFDPRRLKPADLLKLLHPRQWIDELAQITPVPVGVSFSPDSRHIAAAVSTVKSGAVKVWEVATGREVRTIPLETGGLIDVKWSPDGKRLAYAGWDGSTHLWDWEKGKLVWEVAGHEDAVYRLAFRRDGKHLASASWDGTVCVWDVATGERVHRLDGESGQIYCVDYSPDNRTIAAGTLEGIVKVWDADSGNPCQRFSTQLGWVLTLAFSKDGARLACGGWDGSIRFHDSATGHEVLSLRDYTPEDGYQKVVMALAFSPNGHQMLSAGWDGRLRLWDATPLDIEQENAIWKGQAAVFCIDFSPDSRRVVCGGFDRSVRLLDPASGREVLKYENHRTLTSSVAYSPDGKRIASGSFGEVHIWDAETGRELIKYGGRKGNCWRVTFSPDGKRIASIFGQAGPVVVWDAETGKDLFALSGHLGGTANVSFSPDGKLLATSATNSTVALWDAETGKLLKRFAEHTSPVQGLAFDREGKRLATCDWDGNTILWDVAVQREQFRFRVSQERIFNIAFSPDGKVLASASMDGTAKLWDVSTGKELRTYRGHAGVILAIAFSGDGRWLVTAGGHRNRGEARFWDLTK